MSKTEARHGNRDRLYARYVSTHGQDSPRSGSRYWIQRHVIRRLPPSPDAEILDIGCGAGEVVAIARAAGFGQVHGVDISEEQVALARERGIEGIELGDLRTHLQAREGSYDVIIALDVLEHFEPADVPSVLDLVAAALRPGGMLLARTPNGSSPFMGRYRYGDFTHGTAFTARSLRQLLRSTGLREMRFMPVNPVPHGPVSCARALIWQLIAALLKFCLAVETGSVRGHLVTQNLVVIARRSPVQS